MKKAVKKSITFADFEKIDLRAGTILRAEPIEKSRSLVRLTVDFGDHQRTILAGLKEEREDLTALAGLQTLFLVNLEPREMMGEVSEGMLCDVGYADGIKPVFALLESPVPDGTRAG